MLQTLTRNWLSPEAGWALNLESCDYADADLVATNADGDVYLFCFADGSNPDLSICTAIGRLTMMMGEDVRTNAFGLPERDPTLTPPLQRFVLATPADPSWTAALSKIPDRVRRILNLVIVTIGPNNVHKYVEGVPISSVA